MLSFLSQTILLRALCFGDLFPLTVFVIFVRPLIEKELYDYFSDVVYEELYDLLILKG